MRVVIVILDSFPVSRVSAQDTPQLLKFGKSIATGRSLDVSVTYANHAAFFSGQGPLHTGLWGNAGWLPTGGFKPTPEIGPVADTLFDGCNQAGLKSVAIMGWPSMLKVTGGDHASTAWPMQTDLELDRDSQGYYADSAVLDKTKASDLDADLVVVHFNNPDSVFHTYGPDSAESAQQIKDADANFGAVMGLLQDDWDNTLVICWSDHCQESVDASDPIDLAAWLMQQGSSAQVAHNGTAAIVVGEFEREALLQLSGVEAYEQPSADVTLVWSEPLRQFGDKPNGARGNHGGPRCREQLALISGGHPASEQLSHWLQGRTPQVTDWAEQIACLLGLSMPAPSC